MVGALQELVGMVTPTIPSRWGKITTSGRKHDQILLMVTYGKIGPSTPPG